MPISPIDLSWLWNLLYCSVGAGLATALIVSLIFRISR